MSALQFRFRFVLHRLHEIRMSGLSARLCAFRREMRAEHRLQELGSCARRQLRCQRKTGSGQDASRRQDDVFQMREEIMFRTRLQETGAVCDFRKGKQCRCFGKRRRLRVLHEEKVFRTRLPEQQMRSGDRRRRRCFRRGRIGRTVLSMLDKGRRLFFEQ